LANFQVLGVGKWRYFLKEELGLKIDLKSSYLQKLALSLNLHRVLGRFSSIPFTWGYCLEKMALIDEDKSRVGEEMIGNHFILYRSRRVLERVISTLFLLREEKYVRQRLIM